ncbi:putative clathrin assembly protein [Spatholobus suberectus]|nr:putative clathrin assembly protein [Spatholobus suberectus]
MTKLKELIGIMKDKASQGKAAILSKRTTLSLLRATSHDSFAPPTRKHLSTLLSSGDGSRATASAAVELLMDRLQKTQSSAVALKCLVAVHHVIKHGSFILRDQLPYSGGRNYLNLSKFRDKSSPACWELSSWVRWYAKHVEQLLWASRIVGFFVGAAAEEERASGLANGELLRETEALLAVVEGMGNMPDTASWEGNRLVIEIVGLVEEDGVAVLSGVFVRVNEFRERLGCLSFGEVVELVYALNRLEKCKEMMMGAEKQSLWDSVRELKEKVEKMEPYKEEGKTVSTHRATKSDRYALTLLNSVDLVRFPSARFL